MENLSPEDVTPLYQAIGELPFRKLKFPALIKNRIKYFQYKDNFNIMKNLFASLKLDYLLRYKLLLMLLAITYSTIAQTTFTWTGTLNSDWHVPLNWSPNGIPGADDEVIIADVNNDCVISFNAEANQIRIEDNAMLTIMAGAVVVIEDSPGRGINNNGEVINYGTIEIGKSLGTRQTGIDNSYSATFYNDGGTITIDNPGTNCSANCYYILAQGDFYNINGAELLMGQNFLDNRATYGVLVASTTLFINDNSLVTIDYVKRDGIYNGGEFINKNKGEMIIGRIGGVGNSENAAIRNTIGPPNQRAFENDDAIIRIDSGNVGINNEDGSYFYNKNGGQIIIGEYGTVNAKAIDNNDNGRFRNETSSLIHIYIKKISDNANDFTNEGTIVEEATGNSDIAYNGTCGIIQNFNGGTFSIDENDGILTTLQGTIWSGCSNDKWNTDNNWSTFQKPTSEEDVVIANGPNSDPLIDNFTIAAAQSVRVNANAQLTLGSTGFLFINNAISDGVLNLGTIENNGGIAIGDSGAIGQNGIENRGTFNNNGQIEIDDTGHNGIYQFNGTFTNEGSIDLGKNSVITENGILNESNFNNAASGAIEIGDIASNGIYNQSNTFTNEGDISFGQGGDVESDAIFNNNGATFNNTAGLLNLTTDGISAHGIHNKGTFSNDASIDINFTSGSGIHNNTGTFNNQAGVITIDNSVIDGIFNASSGEFNNYATITIGNSSGPARFGINNGATFTNSNGGQIDIQQSDLDGLYNFTNGDFTNESTATFSSQKDIENDGGKITNQGTLLTDNRIENLNGGTLKGNGLHSFSTEWVNDATFLKDNSTVRAYGTSTAKIMGASTTTFYNLQVNKSNNPLKLNTGIQVDHQVQMLNGIIDLNGYDLTLGTTLAEVDDESSFSYITGTNGGEVIKTIDLNTPNSENPGQLGVTITSPADLGSTTIKRGHVVQDVNGNPGIIRYYEITPSNNFGLDATVQFNYLDHELNGILENELAPFRFNGTDWNEYAVSNYDGTANYVETNGLDAFSTWTLSESVAPLPVELINFQAEKTSDLRVELTWQTVSEMNNDHFTVERSSDGVNFEFLEEISGAGNSSQILTYQIFDEQPLAGLNYYRLQQTDFAGTTTYSKIQVVSFEKADVKLSVFPNPVSDVLNITVQKKSDSGRLQLYNELGQLVIDQPTHGKELSWTLNVGHLPAGMYFLHVGDQKLVSTIRIILQSSK